MLGSDNSPYVQCVNLNLLSFRWGRNECEKQQIPKTPDNLRLVLKGALQLIRFPLMSVKDFSLQVAPTELLSDKELVGILIYFNLPPSERLDLNIKLSLLPVRPKG